MKVDLENLFVQLNGRVLPIVAIKAMETEGDRVKLYLKEEYCWRDYSYVMIDGMSLSSIQEKINQTIINGFKKIQEDA